MLLYTVSVRSIPLFTSGGDVPVLSAVFTVALDVETVEETGGNFVEETGEVEVVSGVSIMQITIGYFRVSS